MKNKQNNFEHFLQRTKERYNLDLTLKDLEFIAEEIKSGKAKLIQANSRGFQYKVRFGKTLLIVVLNRSQSHFITCLPMTKAKVQVSFNGKQYKYFDSLYINHLFNEQFKKTLRGKTYCPKCGSYNVRVDLGKDRFHCERCHYIEPFKEPNRPIVLSQTVSDQKFVPVLRLYKALWWFLYINKRTYKYEDIEIEPVLIDDDKLEYNIHYKGRVKVFKRGFYKVDKIKETFNDD